MTKSTLVIATTMMMIAASPIFAVGSANQSLAQITGSTNFVFTENWTADAANGSVPAVLMSGTSAIQGFRIVSVEIAPGSPAPTNNYTVTITDFSGADILGGSGGSQSSTTPGVLPSLSNVPPVYGSLTVNVTGNVVNSAQGRILVYFAPVSQIIGNTPAGSSLTGTNLFTGANTLSGTTTLSGPIVATGTDSGNQTVSGNKTITGVTLTTQLNGCQYVNASQTFAAALAAVGTSGCIQVAPGTFTVSSNATIPVGVTLQIPSGGLLSIANAVTLTINGPIVAGPNQIFAYTGSGVATFGSGVGVVKAMWFPGATADVQINNAVSAIASGGFLDMRDWGPSTQTIAATATFGASGKTITTFLDRTTNFLCSITNGTSCWHLLGGSTLMAFGTVAYPNSGLRSNGSATVSNLLLVDNDTGVNQAGSFVEGLFVQANTGDTVNDAICAIKDSFQLTQWINTSCTSAGATNTVVLKIYATVGHSITNTKLDNVQIDGQGFTGVRPIWIGCAASGSLTPVNCSIVYAVNFIGGLAVHPGTGLPIITIEGSNGAAGQAGVYGQTFVGYQIESSHASDIGFFIDGAYGTTINGLSTSCAGGICGADVVKLAQPAGTTLDGQNYLAITSASTWTNLVNNTINGNSSVTLAQCQNGCEYHYEKLSAAQNSHFWSDPGGPNFIIDQNGATFSSTVKISPGGGAQLGHLFIATAAPTILTHFNTSGDSILANGTDSLTVTVGTGAGTSTGALTLPTATTGWNCHLENTNRADLIQQTGSTTTSATFTNFGTTFAATNWTNSDVLRGGCVAN